jgi:hypothetical protein
MPNVELSTSRKREDIMLGELPDGTLIKLPKGCECICHNEPHWAYMDNLVHSNNRKLMHTVSGFATEEIVRLAEKSANFKRLGIVRIISEPSDELTDIQRAKCEKHWAERAEYWANMTGTKQQDHSPYLNDKTEVRMKAREAL